jgi:hypothetical protein
MVNRHAALFHDLLEMPVAQRVSRVPADADQDHINRKAHPFEVEHVIHPGFGTQFTRPARPVR